MPIKPETEARKSDHIRVVNEEQVQAKSVFTGFEDVHFVHRTVPEVDLKQIDTSTDFFGHRLAAPIIISCMTGGTYKAIKINGGLAQAAEKFGLAMGVGSQRAAVEKPELIYSYGVAREKGPSVFLIGNLGAAQLLKGYGPKQAQQAIDMLKANALVIHLNALQEAAQPEGDTNYDGILGKLKELTRQIKVPVIAKETGAGISLEDARLLEEAGVKGIDAGGAGGTSWSAVEVYRSKEAGKTLHEKIGMTFWDWGIPTVASIVEVKSATRLTVIGSGGVRSGLDVAKAVALGADAVGLAYPFFKAIMEGQETLEAVITQIIAELRTAMFLTGSRNIDELKRAALVITGNTGEWLRARGLKPESFAQRR